LNYCPGQHYVRNSLNAVYEQYASGRWGNIFSAPSCSDAFFYYGL